MKKILLSLAALVAMQSSGFACNMCGCSASNQYLGLLPQNNNNFVGLQYIYRSFSTHHPDDGGNIMPGTSYERYNTWQLTGKYNVTRRLQVMAFVPFVSNTQAQDGMQAVHTTGLGDISVLANYKLIDGGGCKIRHKLLLGGGVKMPTGSYDPQAMTSEEGLPNMQPGTHSWDIIANVNYSAKYRTAGINADVSYVVTTANKENYKFGNRLSSGLSIFREWKKSNFAILPLAGVRVDMAAKDFEQYKERIADKDGGGWQLYGMQGVQVYFKKIGVQAACYEPLTQHYASGMVNSKFRVETGLIFQMK